MTVTDQDRQNEEEHFASVGSTAQSVGVASAREMTDRSDCKGGPFWLAIARISSHTRGARGKFSPMRCFATPPPRATVIARAIGYRVEARPPFQRSYPAPVHRRHNKTGERPGNGHVLGTMAARHYLIPHPTNR